MENNKKVGKEAIKETDSSVSKSDSEKKKSSKNNSKGSRSSSKSRSSSRSSSTPDSNCSCSSCQRRRNQSNQSKSESKSESESEKNKKKKKKKEVRIKFNVKKDNEKPKKETGTKKLKGKLKKVGKNKEYKKEEEEEKEEKEEEKEVEKEEEKEVKKVVKKVDRNIRLISYKEAKELDLDKVAYIALTDGSILIVRKEYGLKSQGLTQKTIDNSNENSIINKSDYLITETIGIENEQNFNNMNNFQQPNKINLKIKKPNFHQILFETEVQRPQQTQSNYPKSEYSYNGQIYSSNITLPNSNMNRSKQYNNNCHHHPFLH